MAVRNTGVIYTMLYICYLFNVCACACVCVYVCVYVYRGNPMFVRDDNPFASR